MGRRCRSAKINARVTTGRRRRHELAAASFRPSARTLGARGRGRRPRGGDRVMSPALGCLRSIERCPPRWRQGSGWSACWRRMSGAMSASGVRTSACYPGFSQKALPKA
eukprot:scaffold216525_cov25-Tisochrysis_lutea.AAC.4